MPKPPETSSLRRLWMQSIMWLILAATVGLAALVDAHKARRSIVALGEPRTIGDVSLRLPKNWETVIGEERMNHDATLEVREDADDLSARVIDVTIDKPSVFDMFKPRQRPDSVINSVPFGDRMAPLMVYTLADSDPEVGATYYIQRLEIARPLANQRVLTLQLSHAGVQPGAAEHGPMMNEDIELLKKIAATFAAAP